MFVLAKKERFKINEVNIKRQNKLKKISRKEIRAEINNKKRSTKLKIDKPPAFKGEKKETEIEGQINCW